MAEVLTDIVLRFVVTYGAISLARDLVLWWRRRQQPPAVIKSTTIYGVRSVAKGQVR